MSKFIRALDRIVAPLLLAAGVGLLTVGVLSYAPSAFGEADVSDPPAAAGNPMFRASPAVAPRARTPAPTPTPSPSTASPIDTVQPSTLPTSPPSASPLSSDVPTSSPAAGVATRIRIPSLSIDLPVVAGDLVIPGADPLYPLCDVALYHSEFVQPGQEGTTYLYAHAQRGMFAPLLNASEIDDGAQIVGSLVEVYTSDDRLHLYEIVFVKRHAVDLTITDIPAGTEQLVLQTSEGVSGTIEKLQVAARPLSVQAALHEVANPTPSPRVCGP